MKDDGSKDAVKPTYGLPPQDGYASQYCEYPNCWSERGVKTISKNGKPDVTLCRYHRKQHLGVSS